MSSIMVAPSNFRSGKFISGNFTFGTVIPKAFIAVVIPVDNIKSFRLKNIYILYAFKIHYICTFSY